MTDGTTTRRETSTHHGLPNETADLVWLRHFENRVDITTDRGIAEAWVAEGFVVNQYSRDGYAHDLMGDA